MSGEFWVTLVMGVITGFVVAVAAVPLLRFRRTPRRRRAEFPTRLWTPQPPDAPAFTRGKHAALSS
ncbi:hypothetical protein [Saccharothrix coeruleofusca]|uniref:Uncharacterized protein n=1 Tax=Saccharothrix coeruleofusca TaxID=33919 RepID=A0A918AHP5_9PSEU|nr:hypothetical protein [Saccharothrix coeruleofusca]GGP37226.1 hypothetical protein GCM10010185_05720 [Saccharothrix coeruleofusca]